MKQQYDGWSYKILYKKQMIEIYYLGSLSITWTFHNFFTTRKIGKEIVQFIDYRGTYGVLYDDILEELTKKGINKDNTKEAIKRNKIGKFKDFLDIP